MADWQRAGRRVKARRHELDRMTQLDLARAAGTSESTIRVLETARRIPAGPVLRSISQALGWTADSIEALADGREPITAEQSPTTADLADELAAVREQMAKLTELVESWVSDRADHR